MSTLADKFIELFKNLKSDAVPNEPRQKEQTTSPNDNTETDESPAENKEDDDHEDIVFGKDDFVKENKKPNFKFPFKSKKPDKDDSKKHKNVKNNENGNFDSVNTQATGAVFNVFHSKDVQFGSNHTYYMSAGNKHQKDTKDYEEEHNIQKDNLIILLMESEIEPTHKFIDFIAKNLGVNWKSFFITLGYLNGRIETMVMEYGIMEARYKLLKDWVNNEDNAFLGRLAELLWDEGERQIVRELSLIYKENKK